MFKRLRKIAAAGVVAAAPLISTLMVPGVAHALTGTTYKWTGTCSTFSAGSPANCTSTSLTWSQPGNWAVSSDGGVTYGASSATVTAPQSTDNSGAGDNIVFDDDALTATTSTNDDIASLKVNNVSVIGTASTFFYSVSGQDLTVAGGVGGSNLGSQLHMQNNVIFTGDQTFGDTTMSNADMTLGAGLTVASGTLTAGSYINASTLTIASGATLKVTHGGNGVLAGAGSLVVASPDANLPYPDAFDAVDTGSASTFSGAIDIQKGAQFVIFSDNPTYSLGTAAITIEDGGQIDMELNPNPAAETGTVTITNPVTMAGNGAGVDQMNQGAIIAGLYDSAKHEVAGTLAVTLSGDVTLTGDTSLASTYATKTTYNFTGNLNKNGHVLGAVTASRPTYGDTLVQVNGQTVAGGSTPAPKTPDTGFALAAAHPGQTLALTLLSAAGIGGVAFKTRRATATATSRRTSRR